METKRLFRQAIITIPIVIVSFIIMAKYGYYKFKKDYSKYKAITNKTIINSRIIEINTNGRQYYTFSDSSYYYSPFAINFNYMPPDINYFLKIGDSLSKQMNSDTLNVFREGHRYIFRFKHKIEKDSLKK